MSESMTDQTAPPAPPEPLTVDDIIREHRRLSAEIAAVEHRLEELDEEAGADLRAERGALYRARDALKGGTRAQLAPIVESVKTRRAELERLRGHLHTLDTAPGPELSDVLAPLDAERARMMAAVSLGDAPPSALAKLDKERERLEREHVAARAEADRAELLRRGLLDMIETASRELADEEQDFRVGLHRVLLAELDGELEAYTLAATATLESYRGIIARAAVLERLSQLTREQFGIGIEVNARVMLPSLARAADGRTPPLEQDWNWRQNATKSLLSELADLSGGIPV